jgi:hypothetical protein
LGDVLLEIKLKNNEKTQISLINRNHCNGDGERSVPVDKKTMKNVINTVFDDDSICFQFD